MAVALVVPAKDESIVAAHAKHIGIAAPLPDAAQVLHLAVPIVAADGIVSIVIAADDDAPVGQPRGTGQHPPAVQTAEAFERVGRRLVALQHEGLSDAQRLGVPTAYDDLVGAEDHGKAVVVAVGHVELVPRPTGVVLGSGRWHEVGGVPARHRQLAVYAEDVVPAARQVQTGQALRHNAHLRA